MSANTTSLIAFEVNENPPTVVVEFLTHKITDPDHAMQLNQQLHALLEPGLPSAFILDFSSVTYLSSTAFGALMAFVVDVRDLGGSVTMCEMDDHVRFGADMVHLSDYATFVPSRHAALGAVPAVEVPWR